MVKLENQFNKFEVLLNSWTNFWCCWQATDLHHHHIDHITIPSKRGPKFGVLKRVEDVSSSFYLVFFILSDITADKEKGGRERSDSYYCGDSCPWMFWLQVFDCRFESGSMPYGYIQYPFENQELFERNFPGHFVAEGLDQIRGGKIFVCFCFRTWKAWFTQMNELNLCIGM